MSVLQFVQVQHKGSDPPSHWEFTGNTAATEVHTNNCSSVPLKYYTQTTSVEFTSNLIHLDKSISSSSSWSTTCSAGVKHIVMQSWSFCLDPTRSPCPPEDIPQLICSFDSTPSAAAVGGLIIPLWAQVHDGKQTLNIQHVLKHEDCSWRRRRRQRSIMSLLHVLHSYLLDNSSNLTSRRRNNSESTCVRFVLIPLCCVVDCIQKLSIYIKTLD